MAFFQLGSGWMLLWGLAAALPILIHLWSRRRHRVETWAAMEFLLAAVRKNARRIQIEQWLLLTVRTAILLLLAVALADPQLSLLTALAASGGVGRTHWVLVIDGSFSMDYRKDNVSRFDAARELARQTVNAGNQGDGYTLVLMADPPRVIIGRPAFERADVLEELDNLQLTHGGAELESTLAEVETIIRRAEQESPRLVRKQICLFTDFQQATWNEATTTACRQRVSRLGTAASISLTDVGEESASNLAVSRLEMNQSVAVVGSEITVKAEIQSFSRNEAGVSAEVLIEGQRIAEERIEISPRGSATVSVNHRFNSPGDKVIQVRLGGDALAVDDSRWLAVPVREAVRVLVAGGRPGETRHLALALNPHGSSTNPMQVTEVLESALVETDLSLYDCVILANIGRFTREEAGVLRGFLDRGGGLIVFLGDQVQADAYNQLLAVDDPAARVLPAKLDALSSEPQYRIDPLAYKHPIIDPFRDHEASGLLTTPIWTYVRLTPLADSRVVLGLTNGDPLLVEGKIGRGRSLLFASAASGESLDRTKNPPTPWTAISSWPSYPPLIHEMVHFAIASSGESRNLLVGDDLSGNLPLRSATTEVIVTRPDSATDRLPVITQGSGAFWSMPDTDPSGIYEVQIGQSPTQKFAVNIDPRESDLARFDVALLPAEFGAGTAEPMDIAGPPLSEQASYFRWILAAVLALVVFEPCLAWHIGRRRQ